MARAHYSDEQRAAALAALDANADNIKRTARETGIPEATLRGWAKGEGIAPGGAELRAQKRGTLAEALEEDARAVRAVLKDKLIDATFLQAVTGLGILVDKMVALRALERESGDGRGEKTGFTDEERWRLIRDLAGRNGHGGARPPARGNGAAVPSLVEECLADLELGLGAPPDAGEPAGPGDVGAV